MEEEERKGKKKEEGREGDKVGWWVPLWTIRCYCGGALARPLAAPTAVSSSTHLLHVVLQGVRLI
jgi:hypothetical protein